MQKSPTQKKIARLEHELQVKTAALEKFNDDHHDQITVINALRAQLKGAEHQIENLQRSFEIAGNRIAVLASDRDRLTAAIEVMARRHASPSAENDRTRAGWRHAAENTAEATRRERAEDKGTDRS